jgi:hypothetical protein
MELLAAASASRNSSLKLDIACFATSMMAS